VLTGSADSHVMRPLDGFRVLDLTANIAGPLAGQVLADLGAEVIKVEPPGGEAARHIVGTRPGEEELRPYFVSNNRGKKSIVADLHSPEGLARLLDLVEGADVLLDGFRPGTMEAWGCGPTAVAERNPRCVYVSITGYGGNGPAGSRPAVDLMIQAESGIMTGLVARDGRPNVVGFQLVDGATGHVTAQAVLAALLHRERHGVAPRVNVSMYDVAISLQANRLTTALHRHAHAAPASSRSEGLASFALAPSGVFRASDGYFVLAAYVPKHWRLLVEVIGRVDLAEDARFVDQASRARNNAALVDELEAVFATRSRGEWLAALQGAGLMAATIASWAEVAASDVFAENELAVTVSDGRQSVRTVRTPARYGTFGPASVPRTPGLGENDFELPGVPHDR
jgi:crotonobetainyl-CoA:carnitine CoA-transferase CaiB-like acyl-CoA transferase